MLAKPSRHKTQRSRTEEFVTPLCEDCHAAGAADAMDARLRAWRRERRFRRWLRVIGFVLGVVLVFMAGISVGARRAASANLVDPQVHYAQRITRMVPGQLACEQDVHEGCLICYHRFAAGAVVDREPLLTMNQDDMVKRIAAAFFGVEKHRELCIGAIEKALREIPGRVEHGYILGPEHMRYDDLRTPGTVTVLVRERGAVAVEVANFEWHEGGSCREQVTKGMCWARDVINAAIESNRLVPGGDITSVEASTGDGG